MTGNFKSILNGLRVVILAVADIQELGQVGSYMLDIMDIIISEKEFFNNIVFL